VTDVSVKCDRLFQIFHSDHRLLERRWSRERLVRLSNKTKVGVSKRWAEKARAKLKLCECEASIIAHSVHLPASLDNLNPVAIWVGGKANVFNPALSRLFREWNPALNHAPAESIDI
jgi:hypothetical protein